MYDMGIHVLDLVVWLFGEIGGISFADDSYGGMETNGILRGTLRIADREVPCRVSASWTHRLMNGIRVVGSDGEADMLFAERNQVIVRRTVGGERIEFNVGPRNVEMPFRSSIPQEALSRISPYRCGVGAPRSPPRSRQCCRSRSWKMPTRCVDPLPSPGLKLGSRGRSIHAHPDHGSDRLHRHAPVRKAQAPI